MHAREAGVTVLPDRSLLVRVILRGQADDARQRSRLFFHGGFLSEKLPFPNPWRVSYATIIS